MPPPSAAHHTCLRRAGSALCGAFADLTPAPFDRPTHGTNAAGGSAVTSADQRPQPRSPL